jgi:hypothetical protein
MILKHYAGIGSRKTPEHIQKLMTWIAMLLSHGGWVLRSGGADGSDTAFEKGADQDKIEIFLPRQGFNHNPSQLYKYKPIHHRLAMDTHPAWDGLDKGSKAMMIRNSAQIMGYEEGSIQTNFVLCWTQNGEAIGGTGQAIRLADRFKLPVLNLQKKDSARLKDPATFLEEGEKIITEILTWVNKRWP